MDNIATGSQDVTDTVANRLCSQDITNTVVNAPASQDISNISVEPSGSQDVTNIDLQDVTNTLNITSDLGSSQDVISICPVETNSFQDITASPNLQSVVSNTPPGSTMESDRGLAVETSMSTPDISSPDSGDQISEALAPTIIEPQYRSSDDNTGESDVVNENHDNALLSVQETSVQDTSMLNTSMEALVGDTVPTPLDFPDSS